MPTPCPNDMLPMSMQTPCAIPACKSVCRRHDPHHPSKCLSLLLVTL
ncbi:hypothetical protein JI435_422220 [Parastagonospora nodorum SN15]|uniref:Uncharacterized protein n=1 Tax=Phaeosphaeria nodorum (strain SN15 / ATCC MYA-4574 / FGSC 10173) TaxID=321614 RepID=A0A7U2NNZ6_PHANO|nr:hypothetical protein JI435_422220 [Parastagonospora nodorum SN15]